MQAPEIKAGLKNLGFKAQSYNTHYSHTITIRT